MPSEAGTEFTVKDAMKKVVVEASPQERKQLMESLQALDQIDLQTKNTQTYKKVVGKKV